MAWKHVIRGKVSVFSKFGFFKYLFEGYRCCSPKPKRLDLARCQKNGLARREGIEERKITLGSVCYVKNSNNFPTAWTWLCLCCRKWQQRKRQIFLKNGLASSLFVVKDRNFFTSAWTSFLSALKKLSAGNYIKSWYEQSCFPYFFAKTQISIIQKSHDPRPSSGLTICGLVSIFNCHINRRFNFFSLKKRS